MLHRLWLGTATLCIILGTQQSANAQSITGYSYVQDSSIYVPACPVLPKPCYTPAIQSGRLNSAPLRVGPGLQTIPAAVVYSDTEEDYTASLYYNVETANATYYEDSTTPLNSQDQPNGSPSSTLNYSYVYPANGDGIYSETTAHILDFFYVTSAGEYYDPFGYSVINGQDDGNYDSGFWFYVNAYGRYIAEASVVLGETYSVINHNSPVSGNPSTPSARTYSVLMQTFIPGNNAQAPYNPSLPFCGGSQYLSYPVGYFQGDNRAANTGLASYRTFQQIMLGLGGAIPAGGSTQDTGYTHLFAPDAISNGLITQAALADTVQGDCHYLIAVGKANTNGMIRPTANGQGGSSASTTLQGGAGNPWAPSGAIQWNAQITLTQSSPTTVNVTGTMFHKCFPAYELSVGGMDLDYQPPQNSDIGHIFTCLTGAGALTEPISTTLVVSP